LIRRWDLEQEEYYFKIYDSNGSIIAYFQPDYGQIEPKEREYEIIERMIKRGDMVYSGLLYIPMVRFNISNEDDYSMDEVLYNLSSAIEGIKRWKEFIESNKDRLGIVNAYVRRAHTDYDMLALLMLLKFSDGLRLSKRDMLATLSILLDTIVDNGLL
jgi:hypothetical protein